MMDSAHASANGGYRTEHDLVGEMRIPSDAYYGIHSLRAAHNFPITGRRLPTQMIESLAQIKKACARANEQANVLPGRVAKAIEQACDELLSGRFHDAFLVDPIQGGAGTSVNMNANEVIANRASELLGGKPGDHELVNPNDHVNCGQSTNDVYPTSIKVTLYRILLELISELRRLIAVLDEKAEAFAGIIKMGRTQLQDAVPIRLGQEFACYAAVLRREATRIETAQAGLLALNLGGTAIGTGINASPTYIARVVPILAELTGLPFVQCDDLVDGTQNLDGYVALAAALKGCGICLSKICNDLRLMSSGPRAGFEEINLPPRQNGSSIMPGKVNPVIPEVINQIAFRLVGCDATVSLAAEAGQLELNAFEPVIFDSLFEGATQLTHGLTTLIDNCVRGITANPTRCHDEVERSIGIITALCPHVGYEAACQLARTALDTNTPVRELALRSGLVTERELGSLLDPHQMTDWQRRGGNGR